MRVKYNQKSVDYLNENLKNQLRLEDFSFKNDSFFTSNKPLYLEIGPGKGKFIIDLASKNLDKNFIVVEINKTIAGYCLKAIDNSKLENVKLIANDFYKLVDLFDQEIFDGIFLIKLWKATKLLSLIAGFCKRYLLILYKPRSVFDS